jgi:hypothetical protein
MFSWIQINFLNVLFTCWGIGNLIPLRRKSGIPTGEINYGKGIPLGAINWV